jgi:predicted ATPase
MLKRIEAKNYRCLRYVSEELSAFQILVGPDASGKTTFLDVVNFMADIVNKGVDKAITDERARTFEELTWANQGGDIELAIECDLPTDVRGKLDENEDFDTIRYELKIGIHTETEKYAILAERAILLNSKFQVFPTELFASFPQVLEHLPSVFGKKFNTLKKKMFKQIVSKNGDGNATFYPEAYEKSGNKWLPSFKIGHYKSALANLPADDTKFPASTWLKAFLDESVKNLILNSLHIRRESRPNQGNNFIPDGSNLPWVIDDLIKNHTQKYQDWIQHMRTALPDISAISVHETPSDKFKYLKIKYDNGIEIPSWTASDGTLRLLALTLIAYLPNFNGIFLIEEPENGVHSKVLETVYRSLSSVYDAQILMATHSPIILNMAKPKDILCFAKTSDGVTDVVRGDEHPKIREWKGNINIGDFYASGILG